MNTGLQTAQPPICGAVFHTDGRRLVFRVEGDVPSNDYHIGEFVNIGPYNYVMREELKRVLCVDELASELHPTPSQDRGLVQWWWDSALSECFAFGFRDLRQLEDWFNCNNNFAGSSFRVGVYAVPQEHIEDGQYQTVFVAEESELIAVLEPMQQWEGV